MSVSMVAARLLALDAGLHSEQPVQQLDLRAQRLLLLLHRHFQHALQPGLHRRIALLLRLSPALPYHAEHATRCLYMALRQSALAV